MAVPQSRAAQAAPAPTSSASSLLREVFEVVVLAVILYFGISFAVQAVHVEGLSMYATLDDNDYLIANKIDYRLHAPQRGDIIILRPPSDNSKDFIKRVIALPGEKLLIRDGVDAELIGGALANGLVALCDATEASSVHVTFAREREWKLLAEN